MRMLEDHISPQELASLPEKPETLASGTLVQRRLLDHLVRCEACAALAQTHWSLSRLADDPNWGAAGESCAHDNVWLELVAGLRPGESAPLLSHAAGCAKCAQALQLALELLQPAQNDETQPELQMLESGTLEWQKEAARKLREASRAEPASMKQQAAHSWWRRPFRSRRLIFAASSAIALGGAVLLGWLHQRQTPNLLIARAFAEQRTIEVRIEGVPYVPLHQERGVSQSTQRMQRPALLAAEAEIARQLKLHPDDVRWLQASGRANLLEDNADSVQLAVTLLEKAHRLAPANDSVSIDLASACILRGDLAPVDPDPGRAIQILKPIADSGRGGETAQWNYAIAEEQAHLLSNAVAEWENFLTRYPRSTWADEARTNLHADQFRLNDQHKRSSVPLRTLDQLAAAFRDRDPSAQAEIDGRIEEYQEVAVEQWLPILFSATSDNQLHQARIAIAGLAATLRDNHGDFWLSDLIAADRASPPLRRAVQLLARSTLTLETSDVHTAEKDALSAVSLFRRAHLNAGAVRSRLILVFAAQYEHRDGPCEDMARPLAASSSLRRYPWIAIQTNLESSLCSPVADSHTALATQTAAALAGSHHFPILTLRCLATQSVLYSSLGERELAWARASDALKMYWLGAYPGLRGYNALVGLEELNRYSDRWFLQVDILREAIPIVAGDPRTLMVAVANSHLGQALIRTGNLREAEVAFLRSDALIRSSVPGPERDALWAETQLGLARIDLERNLAAQCLMRLQAIRSMLLKMRDSPLQLDYFQTSGMAFLKLNRIRDSERDLKIAVDLAAADLRRITSGEDRWRSNRRYEDLFRTIVQLELRKNPQLALFAWEHYKANALHDDAGIEPQEAPKPVTSATLTSAIPLPPGKSSLLLTYVAFPHGYAAWGWDSSGIHEQWISLDMDEASTLTLRFVEECSDPRSSLAALKKDGAALYGEIIRPVEPWLAGNKQVIFEPDGALKELPLELLIDSQGNYLGDRVDVAVSPGLAYLNAGRPWKTLFPDSTAFIIANPPAPGWLPLPAAEEEAHAVASSFSHPQLRIGSGAADTNIAKEIALAEVFHFSGHATTSWGNVGLVGGPGFSDASQLEALRNGLTRLVVLSACSTSDGANGLFDGDSSMLRNLLAAHVGVVVASRWNVDSSSTALLMKAFYSGLMAHESVSAALSAARRAVRNVSGYEHPYYWAAFSVFGHN